MVKYKVVITDFGDPDNPLETEEFKASGLELELIRLNARAPEELFPEVANADALMVQWVKINRPVIERLGRCKVISRYGIGVDMVDLDSASQHGILVCNVPDYCIEEVSTHTVTCLLALNRHLLPHNDHVKAGYWGNIPGGSPTRLSTQVLGIVGLGNIGREVAHKASALGLRLLGYDPYLAADTASTLGVELTSLEDLLHRSDYVSLHCPLTDETRHLISVIQLEMMKPTACLINMSRGPVVDQPALVQALTNGRIQGAALDVLEQEPPSPGDPLLHLENVILTPHVASWSSDAILQLRRETARNVVQVLKGLVPRSVVNRKTLNL